MAFIQYGSKQVCLKIVFWGPGLSGKSTHIQYIHDHIESSRRGRLVSLETESERTLFFDFLPITHDKLGTYEVQLHLFSAPGQVYFRYVRQMLLRGADAVVLVLDSQVERDEANVESFQELAETWPRLVEAPAHDAPLVLSYNKRDLPSAVSIEEMQDSYNPNGSYRFLETIAPMGKNVFACLHAATTVAVREFRRVNPEIPLHGEPLVSPTQPPAPTEAARVSLEVLDDLAFRDEWNPIRFRVRYDVRKIPRLDVQFQHSQEYELRSMMPAHAFTFERSEDEGVVWVRPRGSDKIDIVYSALGIPRTHRLHVSAPHNLEPLTDYEELRVLTVMFVDVQGSTKLWSDRIIAAMTMENLKLLVMSVIGSQGRINKAIGDAFLVVFRSPSAAVAAARTLRRLLQERNRLHPAHALQIKVGIDLGEIALKQWELQAEKELFGKCVVSASRLCDHASGGQIAISRRVHDVLTDGVGSPSAIGERNDIDLPGLGPSEVFLVE